MKVTNFIILVSCLNAVQADVITDDVYIDGVKHKIEVLIDNVNLSWPWPLAVDYGSNNLYFLDNRRPAILNLLNATEHKYIKEVSGSRSLAVDQETHDLYLGTTGGIYKYKPNTGVAELVGAKDNYVWQAHFKGVLYYIDFWLNRVFTLNNEYSDKLDNLKYEVYGLVIDNEDFVFFRNSTGLYSQEIESEHSVLYYDDAIVYNLALDRNGNVYFTSEDGIYEVIKFNTTVRKVISINKPLGLAFDENNNIIYTDEMSIHRLQPIVERINNNTIHIENQLERKVDIIDTKIDKLFTDLVKILESKDEKYSSLSQKNEELLNSKIESMDRKIDELSQKIDILVRDQVERKKESMDKTTVIPLIDEVDEQLDFSNGFPQVIHIES